MGKYAEVESILRRYYDADYKIKSLTDQVEEKEKTRKYIYEIGAQRLTDMPKGSGVSDPVYNMYIHRTEMKDSEIIRLLNEITKLEVFKAQIESMLDKLPEMEEDILIWKYKCRFSEYVILSKLKKEYNYPVSRRQYFRTIDNILRKLAHNGTKWHTMAL